MANMKVDGLEGIGPAFAAKLEEAGIQDTDSLLDAAGTRPGRKELASKTGISEARLLDWANMVDLCRLKGVGPEFAELLEAAGVDTVRELATRKAENLAVKCAAVNGARKLTRRVPSVSVIEGWIEQAKALPPRVEH